MACVLASLQNTTSGGGEGMDDLAEGEIIVSCIRVFLFLSRLPTDLVMIRETEVGYAM